LRSRRRTGLIQSSPGLSELSNWYDVGCRKNQFPLTGYSPRSCKARTCSGVGSVSCRNVGHEGSDFILQRFRQRVPNSSISVSKLCTGKPSGVRREVFFLFADADCLAGATGSRFLRCLSGCSSSNSSGARAFRICHST